MPAKLRFYRTATTGVRPAAANMLQGQLALNSTDGRIYQKKTDNTVVEARTKGVFNISASLTLTQAHIFGFIRNTGLGITVTIPLNLMQPGEELHIRHATGLGNLTLTGATGVTITGSTGFSLVTGTLWVVCYAANNYEGMSL